MPLSSVQIGRTALHLAANTDSDSNVNADIVAYLIQERADINAKTLVRAFDCPFIVVMITTNDCMFDDEQKKKYTPLDIATKAGNPHIVEYLLMQQTNKLVK